MGIKEIVLNFLYSRILDKGLLIRFFLAAIFYVVLIISFLNCGL